MNRFPNLTGLVFCLALPLAAQQPGDSVPLSQLQKMAASDSNDATVQYRLAMAWFDRKKWDQAEEALTRAVTVAPGYADALLALSVLPLRRGVRYWQLRSEKIGKDSVGAELRKAVGYYRRAFLNDPLVDLKPLGKYQDESGTYLVVGNRLVLFHPWWDDQLEKAVNELRQHRYDEVYARTGKLIADPRSGQDMSAPSPVLWYHGLAAAHLGNFETAQRDFAILTGRLFAIEKDSTNADASIPLATNDFRYAMATMLYLGGHPDQAIPVYRRVLEVDFTVYSANVQMARIFEAAGMLDSALAERRQALSVNPDDPDLHVDLAVTLMKAGQFPQALDALAEGARLNPHDARTPYFQGLLYDHLNRPAEARQAWGRFLDMAPSRFDQQRQEVAARLPNLGP